MKKLFLLLSAGLFAISVNAQQSQSVMLSPSHAVRHNIPAGSTHFSGPAFTHAHHSNPAARTTGAQSYWFDYYSALQGANSVYTITPMYQDSTVMLTPGQGSPYYNFIMGLGVSFDPESLVYSTQAVNQTLVAPFVVTNTDAYTIDSISFQGLYFQTDASYTDTLFVDLAVVGSTHSGTYTVYDSDVNNNLLIPNQHYNFATANYDTGYNGIASNVATREVIKIPLNASTIADTNANGINDYQLQLATPLVASAGDKIIADIHFKGTQPHVFGADLSTLNHFELFTGQITSGNYDQQLINDASSGLVQQSFERYLISGPYTDGGSGPYYANLSGQPIINGSYLSFGVGDNLSDPFDPFVQFHLNCNTCNPLSVNTVNNVTKISAYPNPANDNVNISFTLGSSANVTVTLVNEIGQTVRTQNLGTVQSGVATLNTSGLSGGLYFYTVNAGGQRSTGKVLVAH